MAATQASEFRPNAELNLQRVTGATLDRTVEVEDETGTSASGETA